MNALARFDNTGLTKAFIGLDQIFDNFEKHFLNQTQSNYPPYNVIKGPDNSRIIEVAVTGFDKDEIIVEQEHNQLIIKATSKENSDEQEFIFRGLATRDFERRFALLEHMEVGDATVENGLLRVYIKHIIPEALKPRRIELK